MYCGHCGQQIPDGSLFCPECGQQIGAGAQAGAAAQPGAAGGQNAGGAGNQGAQRMVPPAGHGSPVGQGTATPRKVYATSSQNRSATGRGGGTAGQNGGTAGSGAGRSKAPIIIGVITAILAIAVIVVGGIYLYRQRTADAEERTSKRSAWMTDDAEDRSARHGSRDDADDEADAEDSDDADSRDADVTDKEDEADTPDVSDLLISSVDVKDGKATIVFEDGTEIPIEDDVREAEVTPDREHVVVLLEPGYLYITDKAQSEQTWTSDDVESIVGVLDQWCVYEDRTYDSLCISDYAGEDKNHIADAIVTDSLIIYADNDNTIYSLADKEGAEPKSLGRYSTDEEDPLADYRD